MARFNITAYGIGELAEAYYPDREYSTAVRLFNRDLHRTRGLLDALRKQGFKDGDRIFTRAQVRVIVKYLGDP